MEVQYFMMVKIGYIIFSKIKKQVMVKVILIYSDVKFFLVGFKCY